MKLNNIFSKDKKQRLTKEIIKKALDEEKEKDPNCTFKPNLITANYASSASKDDGNDFNFIDRAKMWIERRDFKLSKHRQKDENKDLEECTFQPVNLILRRKKYF